MSAISYADKNLDKKINFCVVSGKIWNQVNKVGI